MYIMTISSLIFSSTCAGCGRTGDVLCRSCRFALVAPPQRRAESEVIAALPFAGRARDVLLGYKYGNRRQLAHHFAGLVVNRVLASGCRAGDFDVVTWAPTGAARRHRRGFDQAEVVARRVAAQLGLPCRRMLVREHGGPQTGKTRHHRLLGPIFRAHPASDGQRVLLIDDIVTTGATLRSAAHALRSAGAVAVTQAAVASTPAFEPAANRFPDRPVRRLQESSLAA